jgi:hypothetical protein
MKDSNTTPKQKAKNAKKQQRKVPDLAPKKDARGGEGPSENLTLNYGRIKW